MPDLRIAADLYSFRFTDRVFGSAFQPATPSAAALAAIEAKLTAANADYAARRYQAALQEYRDTASLVWQQLNPNAPGGSRVASLDPRLFGSLFSMALEWMNVLPVTQPVAGVRPRDPVDPAILAEAARFDNVGLRSTAISAGGGAGAVADYQTGELLEAGGNDKAAAFFLDRARRTSPDLIASLDSERGSANAPGPVERGVPA